jgi:hypothetical protein
MALGGKGCVSREMEQRKTKVRGESSRGKTFRVSVGQPMKMNNERS